MTRIEAHEQLLEFIKWHRIKNSPWSELDEAFKIALQALESSDNKWVSVEDELPERGEDVLIITPQNLVHIAAYKYRNWQTKAHVFVSGIDGYSWNNVTHWMPLPAPPRKEILKI